MILRFAALLLAIHTVGIAQGSQSGPTATSSKNATCELGDKDYAVFGALFSNIGTPEHPEEEQRRKEFVILDETADTSNTNATAVRWYPRSRVKPTAQQEVELSPQQDTIADFTSRRGSRCPVKAEFADRNDYTIVGAEETEGYFDQKKSHQDGWKIFYENHPEAGGFWQFSRPGYNVAGDEALVYVSHSCGWVCATGHLYLLVRLDGQWKVKNRVMLWIS